MLGFEEEFSDVDWGFGLRTDGTALILVKSERGASGVSLVLACDDIQNSLESTMDACLNITDPVEEGHWGVQVVGFDDPEGNTIYLEQPNRGCPDS